MRKLSAAFYFAVAAALAVSSVCSDGPRGLTDPSPIPGPGSDPAQIIAAGPDPPAFNWVILRSSDEQGNLINEGRETRMSFRLISFTVNRIPTGSSFTFSKI